MTIRLLGRTEIRHLAKSIDFRPRKSFGQNFVHDANTVRRIVAAAGLPAGATVLEVGPGLGSLTLGLLEAGHPVIAVEIDARLAAQLPRTVEKLQPDAPLTVATADALRIDAQALHAAESAHQPAPPTTLVANLPYNISVPLVCDLLDAVPAIHRMVVMVQREVGERLVAAPGDDAYGLPSLKVAFHAEARLLGRVPPSVFLPRPRVDSALVEVVRRPSPVVDADPAVLFSLARAGFGQRRKMLRRSLRALVDEGGLEAAGVEPTARAEELGLAQWADLARQVSGAGTAGGAGG